MFPIFKDKKAQVIAAVLLLVGCLGVHKIRSHPAQVLPVSFTDFVLSPDGKNFVATGEDFKEGLLLIPTEKQRPHLINQTESAQWPVWGADSRTIYFMSNVSTSESEKFSSPYLIRRKDVFSEDAPETLLSFGGINGSVNYPMPSPDGQNLAYEKSTVTSDWKSIDHICILNLNTKQNVEITNLQPVPKGRLTPQWSADGKTLYFRGQVGDNAQDILQLRKRMNSSKNGLIIYPLGGTSRFLAVDIGYWKVSNSGAKFATAVGFDSHGESNVLRVVDMESGKELNLIKDPSIFPDMFWNKDDSALYYLTGGAAGVVKIHRWNMADNSVTVVATETKRRGRLLGIANGRLYYSIVQGKDNSGDNSEVKSIPVP